jgi:hypothetical protein
MSTPNPWAKGPPIVRKQTDEEKQAGIRRVAEQKANELKAALNYEAGQLANRVETAISSRDGGFSSNYAGDEQLAVSSEYSEAVILLAFEKWKEKYISSDILALNLHKLGPSPKYTGGRGGKLQANFLRLISSEKSYKFNVHIDAKS